MKVERKSQSTLLGGHELKPGYVVHYLGDPADHLFLVGDTDVAVSLKYGTTLRELSTNWREKRFTVVTGKFVEVCDESC